MVVLRLRNRVDDLAILRSEVLSFAKLHAFSAEEEAALQLALEEVVANIINYAHNDDDTHEILIEMSATDSSIRARVEDDGVPFDPRQQPPPDVSSPLDDRQIGGVGIHLLRDTADELSYRRENDRNVFLLVLHRRDNKSSS